jgi:hypothetical protein
MLDGFIEFVRTRYVAEEMKFQPKEIKKSMNRGYATPQEYKENAAILTSPTDHSNICPRGVKDVDVRRFSAGTYIRPTWNH